MHQHYVLQILFLRGVRSASALRFADFVSGRCTSAQALRFVDCS